VRLGGVIVAIDDEERESTEGCFAALKERERGQDVTLTVVRDDINQTLTLYGSALFGWSMRSWESRPPLGREGARIPTIAWTIEQETP
jgi:hypothetical protein